MFAQPSRLARGMRDPSLPHAPAYHHTHYGHQRQPRCLPRVSSIEGPAGSGMPVDPQELWQRLSLAKRQLSVAVAEEDFKNAARLRDELKKLQGQLSPVQQYNLGQLEKLSSADLQDRLRTIFALGEAGDDMVVPELVKCLGDPDTEALAHDALWKIFMRSNLPEVKALMDEGCRFLRPDVPVSPRALEYFDRIIAMAPSFAEAYNKKATVLYLLGRYAESVEECKAALQLQPYHFGAASGMGLCYMKLGRYNEAADAFARCLQIHPGLTGTAKLLEVARRNAAEAEAEGGSGQE